MLRDIIAQFVLSQNLYLIMEVPTATTQKTDYQFHSDPGCLWTHHIVVHPELTSLWLCDSDLLAAFRDIPDLRAC